MQDTNNVSQVLNRSVFTTKVGINKVLAVTKTEEKSSLIEILLNAEFNYIPTGLYVKENQVSLMAASTISVRIANNIYLPIEVKYDPASGNVLGF